MSSFSYIVLLFLVTCPVTRTGAVSPGFCISEIVSPTTILYDWTWQNYLMVSMCILYCIASIAWMLGLWTSRYKTRSLLDLIIGLIADFSMIGYMNFIKVSFLWIPLTFVFQTAATCLVAFCLLLISNGQGITKSPRSCGWNLFFAAGACVAYFCFIVAAEGAERNGLAVEMARTVVDCIACFLLVFWVLVNVVFTYAKVITDPDGNVPRRLFYQHFIELFCTYCFCSYVLFITEFVGCSYNWASYAYFITATIRSTVAFLLLIMLMLMLRPSRMAHIGFGQVQSSMDDLKKSLVKSLVISDESTLEP